MKYIIYGSSGFAKEILWLLEELKGADDSIQIIGFIDDDISKHGEIVNGYPVLGGEQWIADQSEINVVIGIGDPRIKKVIREKLDKYSHVNYPVLIAPSVRMSKHIEIGKGSIITDGVIMTTNIKLGDFVTVNLDCTVGHDAVIEDYVTLLPSVNVSGNVVLKTCSNIGTGTAIIQGITVGEGTIVGAGAVVVKNLPNHCTAVGSPAKPIKYHNQ